MAQDNSALPGIVGLVWALIFSCALWSVFYLLLGTVARVLGKLW